MSDDEFTESVKHKFCELERRHGRVPTMQELSDALGIDSRILSRKLQKAIARLGTENQIEGTSAFKSTLSELLSGELLLKGMPGFVDLNMLLNQARRDPRGFSMLSWKNGRRDFQMRVSIDDERGHLWFLFCNSGVIFERISNEIGDILALLDSISNNEFVDGQLITHMDGEPVPYEPKDLPYRDPIPAEQLPHNVLPFRKPYQHSDE